MSDNKEKTTTDKQKEISAKLNKDQLKKKKEQKVKELLVNKKLSVKQFCNLQAFEPNIKFYINKKFKGQSLTIVEWKRELGKEKVNINIKNN